MGSFICAAILMRVLRTKVRLVLIEALTWKNWKSPSTHRYFVTRQGSDTVFRLCIARARAVTRQNSDTVFRLCIARARRCHPTKQ